MYFKIIIISVIVVAVWVNAIQPMIEEWLFERRMKSDDEEINRKKECECNLQNYYKKYFPGRTKRLIVK